MAELETGAVVASHWVIVSLLGVGGMGAVYRARDTRTDTLSAIKVLREARGHLAARFLREARIASALAHPNIARVDEVLELDDGTPAIVMELLSGESLGARLARTGRLAPATIARIAMGVVAAMKAAHERGVIHRDLKPDNVFLCDDGGVKVLDFGIAKVTSESADPAITAAALTETGQLLGTPHYMAPEQIFGEKDVDGRADVWALGVILYQALAGVRPFEGANAGQIFKAIALEPPRPLAERAPSTPPELVELVDRMLVHARADRLADLDLVERVLERVVAKDHGEAPALHPSGAALAVAAPEAARPSRGPLVVAAASIVAVGAAAFVVLRAPPHPLAAPIVPAPAAPQLTPPSATEPAARHERDEAAPASSPPAPAVTAAAPIVRAPPARAAAITSAAWPPPSPPPTAATATPATDAGPRTNRSGSLRRDEF